MAVGIMVGIGILVGVQVAVGAGVRVAVGLGVSVGVRVGGTGVDVKVADGGDVGIERVGTSVGSTKMDTMSPLICNAPRKTPTVASSKIGIIHFPCPKPHPQFSTVM